MTDSPLVKKIKDRARALSEELVGSDKTQEMLSAAKDAIVEGGAQLGASGKRIVDELAPVPREEFEALARRVDDLERRFMSTQSTEAASSQPDPDEP